MSYKSEAKGHAERRIERVKRECGGVGEMKKVADREAVKAVHAHEKHEHSGKLTPFSIEGKTAKKRLDRAGYKKGGAAKSKGTEVNIIIADKGGQQPGMPAGMPPATPPAMPPAAAMPPRPPMAPPPGAGAPPPGMGAPPQAMPPGMMPRKRGGKAGYDAGAGSGMGRLEKAAKYGAKT
jgi:hypothetical protein